MHTDYNDRNQFVPLSEADHWKLENSSQDLRGQPLLSREGESLGTVREMIINRERERVAALILSDGRTVPIDQVELRDNSAYLMSDTDIAGRSETGLGNEQHIPIIEDRMVVGKREVESGGVHVRTHMEERPVEETVMLRKEHVDVERRPVTDGRIEAGQADRLMGDREFNVTATSEEAVIGRDARVKEELVIRKDVDSRAEKVTGTERHTEVDIDKVPSSDRR